MVRTLIEKLERQADLTTAEAEAAMHATMRGEVPAAQLGGFLVALAIKGERPHELVGLASAMRAAAEPLPISSAAAVDTCGTGGDRSHTFNISTAAALVAAACGLRVAKHGNRAVSSRCGSADVLEALGVKVAMTPAAAARCFDEVGFTFLFAPVFHPSMRHAAQARRDLGVRTAFNLLGPLTNPARPRAQLVGVPRPELTELLARALLALGTERAWVVHGADGLDELSVTGYTKVSQVADGSVRSFYLHPADVGMAKASLEMLAGGDAAGNAAILRQVFDGERGGPRDAVLLNAGAAMYLDGSVASLREGIATAAAAIDAGQVRKLLERVIVASQREVA